MSVATQLGLGDPENDLLGLARQRWSTWQSEHQVLCIAADLTGLPAWLGQAGGEEADSVLLALAELAAPDGGDDVAAVGALVWVLLPGASLLAHRLRTLTHRIDEVVAAQLWVEARTFPWQRGRKVAANVLMNTRRGVMRDLGIGEHTDTTWFRSIVLSPTADLWREIETRESTVEPAAVEELAEVLGWACASGVITAADWDLLVSLAEAADRARTTRLGRGQLGLMAPAASEAVAARWGISARTVRRRAARTVQALTVACAESRISA